MKAVFADTSFFVAILNDRDSLHGAAREAAARETEPRLTTEFVLLEVANFCVREHQRAVFALLIDNLRRAGPLKSCLCPTMYLSAVWPCFWLGPTRNGR
jgi:predicted nucleic acid-binding protein